MRTIAALLMLLLSAPAFGQTLITNNIPQGGDHERYHCDVYIQGELGVNLLQEYADFMRRTGVNTFEDRPQILCLNSPGGSVVGALDLAEALWHDLPTMTRVAEGDECLSSCVLLLLAGRSPLTGGPNRFYSVGSEIAVHGFFWDDDVSELVDADVVDFTKNVSGRILSLVSDTQAHPELANLMMVARRDQWISANRPNTWLISPRLFCFVGYILPMGCEGKEISRQEQNRLISELRSSLF